MEIIVQINGKVKGKIIDARGALENEVKSAAMEIELIKQTLKNQQIKKIINVPNRLINFVV